jgi:hypothetical protein
VREVHRVSAKGKGRHRSTITSLATTTQITSAALRKCWRSRSLVVHDAHSGRHHPAAQAMTTLCGHAPSQRVLTLLAVGVVLSALALAAVYAWFVPISIDGGWYSYPGYALSQGRDPGENMREIDGRGGPSRPPPESFCWPSAARRWCRR